MKPYYKDDLITIYHGDCLELLPELAFDVVVTDPPYGINVVGGSGSVGGSGWVDVKEYKAVIGDDVPLDPTWLAGFGRRQVIFGFEHFTRLPHVGRLLVWDKEMPDGLTFAQLEAAWDSQNGPARIFRHRQNGFMNNFGDIKKHHPTQKPLSVMTWIVSQCSDAGDVVVDPYMGSGSTLRAAKDLGRKAIGIEIDEAYCEIAAKRMGQEVLDFA